MNKDNLNREEFLDRLSKKESFDDPIDKKAAEGWGNTEEAPKDILNRLDNRLDSHTRNSSQWIKIAVAVAAIVVIGIVTWNFTRTNSKVESSDLYAEYYAPMPNTIPLTRGEDAPGLTETMQLYEAKDYQACVDKIESFIAEGIALPIPIYFYQAMCYIELGEMDLAEELLVEFQAHNTQGEYVNEAMWYLSLILIKQGKIEDAKSYLMDIDKNHYLFKVAQKLLKELE